MNEETAEEISEIKQAEESVETAVDIDDAAESLTAMDETEEQENAANPESDLEEQIRNNMLRNVTLADAEMKMFGDRTVLAQVA